MDNELKARLDEMQKGISNNQKIATICLLGLFLIIGSLGTWLYTKSYEYSESSRLTRHENAKIIRLLEELNK